jgi:NAD(P)-dependent dehydrogenase (short-subunit alcohol dehydrogenase family)
MIELKGKTLILTGASMGIGRALARELAQKGVRLVLNARSAGLLDEVTSRCRDSGASVLSISGSAADDRVATKLVDAALELGDFHGFIQVAGVLHPGPFLWELSQEQFRDVFDASVMASYQMVRYGVPELRRQGRGVAVFFGSGAAERAVPGIAAYCGAKAAEEHLARQIAAEAPEITAFVYRPGVVETRMQEQARTAQGGAAEGLRHTFWQIKNSGELISPDVAARSLVRILTGDPRRFHGRIATWRDGIE